MIKKKKTIFYRLETRQIRGALFIKIFMGSFKIFHSKIALFLSILSYVFLGNYINTEKVMSHLNIIRVKHKAK